MHARAAALLGRQQWTQRTPEWYDARRELLTASDAAAALGVKPYASYRGDPRAELLHKKVHDTFLSNMFVVHGQKYEDEACDLMALCMGEVVETVGLVRHATETWLGASPDGVTRSGRLVEIKCPLKRTIVPGHVPEHYYPQIQTQMEVCDVDSTLFVQYKPAHITPDGRPFIDIVVIDRDRAWFAANRDALHAAWHKFVTARRAGPKKRTFDEIASGCLIVDDLYCVGDSASSTSETSRSESGSESRSESGSESGSESSVA